MITLDFLITPDSHKMTENNNTFPEAFSNNLIIFSAAHGNLFFAIPNKYLNSTHCH